MSEELASALTFEELDDRLPNGFHDARIEKLDLDYVRRSARIVIQLCTGTPESNDPELRDSRRTATLKLTGLAYFAIEPPDSTSSFMRGERGIDASGYPEDPANFPVAPLQAVMPKNINCYRFFVHDWNSFIHIAAELVRFSWTDEEQPQK
jgi:hypothetical protein